MKYLLIIYIIIGFIIASMDLYAERKELKEEPTPEIIAGFGLVWFLWPVALIMSWIRTVIMERKEDLEKDSE
jgi:hypothetical protein